MTALEDQLMCLHGDATKLANWTATVPSLLAVIAGTLGMMLQMKSADVRMTIKK